MTVCCAVSCINIFKLDDKALEYYMRTESEDGMFNNEG